MTFIYFARIKDTVKIGRTQDIYARVAQLQTSIAEGHLEVLRLLVERSRGDERRVQDAFREHRMAREWFRFDPGMLTMDFGLEDIEPPEVSCPLTLWEEDQPAMFATWRARKKDWLMRVNSHNSR